MTSELKPCPFCGAKAKFKGGRLSQDSVTIWCENLHRSGGFATKEAAAADWNTRAVPDVAEFDVNQSTTKGVECHKPQSVALKHDVPELVRYDKEFESMFEREDGKYVLYTQAAEIIAAEQQKTKDAEELAFRMDRFATKYLRHKRNAEQRAEAAETEIEKLKEQNDKFKWQVRDTCTRAEAAEAKLAQIKAKAGGAAELLRYSGGGIMWGMDSPGGAKPTPDGEYVLYADVLPILTAKDAVIASITREGLKDLGDQIKSVGAQAKPAPSADLKTENDKLREALEIIEAGHDCPSALARNVLNPAGAKP